MGTLNTENDIAMSKLMVNILANFAISDNPNSDPNLKKAQWKPASKENDNLAFLKDGKVSFGRDTDLEKRYQFLKENVFQTDSK